MSQSILPFENLYMSKGTKENFPNWIMKDKHESWKKFCNLGLPKKKTESWKYSNLSFLSKVEYLQASQKKPHIESIKAFKRDDALNLIFYNGTFLLECSDLSKSPKGLHILPFHEAYHKYEKKIKQAKSRINKHFMVDHFVELTRSLHHDGIFIMVDPDYKIEVPINIIYITSSQGKFSEASFPYLMIFIEKHSSAKVFETYVSIETSNLEVSQNCSFSNKVSEIILEENSTLNLISTQNLFKNIHHISHSRILQAQSSSFKSYSLSSGAQFSRHSIDVIQEGAFAHTSLDGVFLAHKKQHCEQKTSIAHCNSHGTSDQLYKGIFADQSRGVFLGNIKVFKDTEKNRATQLNKNLLVSPSAEIDTTPQLEIDASDVKCSHGGTVSQLRDDEILYLRSRGIPKSKAIRLLSHAFTNQVLERIPDHETRSKWNNIINRLFLDNLPSEDDKSE